MTCKNQEKKRIFSFSNFLKIPEKKSFFSFFLFAGLFCFLFGNHLFHGGMIGYRDSAFFYYPLFNHVQSAFNEGRIPLWDPFENMGEPLAANPAAAVFYPVRAFFFAGTALSIPYDLCFQCYLFFHLGAAFFTFYFLARCRFTDQVPLISRSGGLFAALAWTFSGSILFQITNPAFLVGAAWLPLLITSELKILAYGFKSRYVFLAALSLFLMITGGDPQAAYAGTLLFFPLFFFMFRKLAPGFVSNGEEKSRFSYVRNYVMPILAFFFSLILGLGLSAVQVIPAGEMTFWSSRGRVSKSVSSEISDEDRFALYQFSVPPWRAAEFLWPGIGGKEFPINSRWFSSLPNDKQVWSPTLYMGLYPFLAAVSAFLLIPYRGKKVKVEQGEEVRDRFRMFLTWLFLLAFLASWGGFGLGWFSRIRSLSSGLADGTFRGNDPVGGIYWLMVHFVPGWPAFRYPAKVMTFGTLGLALLAGIGWDRFRKQAVKKSRPSIGLFFLLIISLAGFFFVQIDGIADWVMERTGKDLFSGRTIYGPLLPEQAKSAVRSAMMHTALLTFLLILILRKGEKSLSKKSSKILAGVTLFILAADLGVAQKWIVTPVAGTAYRIKSPITAELHNLSAHKEYPPRLYRDSFLYPSSFLNSSSPNRLTERVCWDRATLFQKNASLESVANIDVRGTFVAGGYLPISRYLRSSLNRWKRSGIREPGFDRLLASMGTDFFLVSVPKGEGETERGIEFKPVPNGGKRVRILHRNDRYSEWQDLVRYDLESEQFLGESATITDYQSERIEVDAVLTEPGKLFVAEEYFPGWRAQIYKKGEEGEGICVPIKPIASAFRQIELPAGEWRIVMEYKPVSFWIGGGISCVVWLACGLFFGGCWLTRR